MGIKKGGYVYILTNKNNTVLYTGVTSYLEKRLYEHRVKLYPNSFTSKYNCSKIVYYMAFDNIIDAIAEEKRIKAGNRFQKIKLITDMNPTWEDLTNTVIGF